MDEDNEAFFESFSLLKSSHCRKEPPLVCYWAVQLWYSRVPTAKLSISGVRRVVRCRLKEIILVIERLWDTTPFSHWTRDISSFLSNLCWVFFIYIYHYYVNFIQNIDFGQLSWRTLLWVAVAGKLVLQFSDVFKMI